MRTQRWGGALVLLAMGGAAGAQTTVGVTGQGGRETVTVHRLGLSESRAIAYPQMPSHRMANGGESRLAMRGVLPDGVGMEVHESAMAAGMQANPAHVVEHAEVITVIEGTLRFLHDGRADLVTAGGVIYVAKGSRHTVENAGQTTVRYVVVEVGGDAGS